ncbi:MAG: electron transport complex subunit RsxA [Clostridiales bacterium]|mgnify:CR=1 FL=1|nr:electron transport complex subunit RsxA [Bacillota bacterium]NLK91033.1 electron transport complex subunit RsxA [Clostridiales bacterium]
MVSLFVIIISGILINNYVLSRILGICPFLGVSKQVETAFGMSMAVTFVMTLAGVMTWLAQTYILEELGLGYMQTVTFILVIAALVQFVEMVIQKFSPTLYQSLGIYLPLITTNCAVLGVSILNIKERFGLLETAVNSAASAIGFGLAIVLFAGIRERLELSNIPEAFKGFPIALFTASLMSLAFLGFAGLV